MLFAGWEVRVVENCDLSRSRKCSIFKIEVTVFHNTDRPLAVNNIFIYFSNLTKFIPKEPG